MLARYFLYSVLLLPSCLFAKATDDSAPLFAGLLGGYSVTSSSYTSDASDSPGLTGMASFLATPCDSDSSSYRVRGTMILMTCDGTTSTTYYGHGIGQCTENTICFEWEDGDGQQLLGIYELSDEGEISGFFGTVRGHLRQFKQTLTKGTNLICAANACGMVLKIVERHKTTR